MGLTYDQLEEQYYVLKERVRVLEAENNSLVLRNTELETESLDIERQTSRLTRQNERLVKDYQEKVFELMHVKVISDEKQQRLEDALRIKDEVILTAKNPRDLQALENTRPDLPRFSIHLPMEERALNVSDDRIVLNVTDSFKYQLNQSPIDFSKKYHVMAKCNGSVFRYSSESLLSLERPVDFGVVLEQMVDGLKSQIVNQYFDQRRSMI